MGPAVGQHGSLESGTWEELQFAPDLHNTGLAFFLWAGP